MWDCRDHVLMMAQKVDSENRSSFYQGDAATSLAFSKDLLQRLMMDKEEESGDEVELNLGLSLGGCHVKAKKEKAVSVNLHLDLHRKDLNCEGSVGLGRDEYGHGDFRLQRPDMDDGSVGYGFGLRQEKMSRIHDPPRPTSQQQQQEMFTSQQQQDMLEQQRKRELHALRRQEARKKREEKQLHKARREAAGGMRPIQPNKAGKNENGVVPLASPYAAHFPMRGGSTVLSAMTRGGSISSEEDKKLLGAQMSSIREKHRAGKESDSCRSDRKEKVSKASDQGDLSIEDKSSRTSHETDNMVSSSNGGGDPPSKNEVSGPERSLPASQAAYPVMPMSYPFPMLAGNSHCMPMHLGYTYPYIMPFWPATSTGAPESLKSTISNPPLPPNVLQPIPTRAFPPFQMPVSGTSQTSWFADPQKCTGTGPTHSSHASGASSGRSSSAVSENEPRSPREECSNDSKSQSSASSAMETLQRVSSPSKTLDQTVASSEVSSASQVEPPRCPEVVAQEKVPSNAAVQSALATSTTTTMAENQITEASSSSKASQQGCSSTPQVNNTDYAITSSNDQAHQGQPSSPSKTCKDNKAHNGQSLFANMPCVSTTGEDGKTINGFLYSYRGGEVSIVCVCHGTLLSPAEFVQHAGRTDVSHPERHIVVNTSLCAVQDGPAMG
ncbi:ninja-family protein mc410 [Cryptomeria japonica]|uniref:ninja-family protein mc410 n=1 Tax=Cryptomeria japonica TaxID=3369 RepID=UPI0025ACE24F|nr:ninja-family protein mc410 [Cryptomeria japonica]